MPSFRDRVEDYIGSVDDTTALDQFLKDAAQEVLSGASPDFLLRNAKRHYSTSSAGFSIKNRRELSVNRRFEGSPVAAKEVTAGDSRKVSNPESLHYATNRSPVYYRQVTATDARIFVKPDPAATAEVDIAYIEYPTPGNTDTSASGLPTEAEEAVVLGTAIRVLQRRLADHQDEEDVEMVASVGAEIGRIEQLYARQLERLQRDA